MKQFITTITSMSLIALFAVSCEPSSTTKEKTSYETPDASHTSTTTTTNSPDETKRTTTQTTKTK